MLGFLWRYVDSIAVTCFTITLYIAMCYVRDNDDYMGANR